MKLPELDILAENNKLLRTKSKPVTFPLTEKDKKYIKDMLIYLEMSQIDATREEFDLRAGWGLSAVQIGIPKRFFVVAEEIKKAEDENKKQEFNHYVIINPKVISESEEMIYVGEGEGCLSVTRDIEGIVPRHARITIKYQDMNGVEQTLRVREELSVCFQHEIDHLNGILFIDRIDKKNPFKGKEVYREI